MPNPTPESPTSSTPRLLIVGCGYLGSRVGQLAKDAGWNVQATTRSNPSRIADQGLHPILLDWNEGRSLANLPVVDRMLIAVSHDRSSSVDRFESQVGGLTRLIQASDRINLAADSAPADLCYISTTGVYHQTDGQWVDETSTTRPTREGGQAHLQAEAKLRSLRGNARWTILRLAGIYGPNRVPRAADVRAGRPIASPESGYLNLIHVHDASKAVMAAFETPDDQRERLYLISDDEPVIRRAFYEQIALQTQSPVPTFVSPEKESGVRFRSETNKRIWNRRMKRDLVRTLQYPTYREGLADVLVTTKT